MHNQALGIWKSVISTTADFHPCIRYRAYMALMSVFGRAFGVDPLLSALDFLLFSLACNKSSYVMENNDLSNGRVVWFLTFKSAISNDESQMYAAQLLLIDGYFVVPNREDVRIRIPENRGYFSFK